ncbi:threonine ammonia-lyase, biosynthetic [Dongshaea marina]|uniref:threonine ammonia-lyase, biosynthetic n=1 Tax=Dongshaea marina TaxID=2047966 RepID=UPI000D3E743A|nr:threonine ammonia-lyase, biosynthetic [Dongshaea marina]
MTAQLKHSATPQLTSADYLREILISPVYEAAQVTPLQPLAKLSQRLGNQVLLKREDHQPVNSFKLRGAYNMMAKLPQAEREQGVITASAGNHAQGVALSATKLKMRAVIVMPAITPDIKVEAVRHLGGEVILHGNNFDEAKSHAEQLASEQQLTFVPPFDHPQVITGQGTIGMELLQQNSQLDYIFVPVGGGGMAAGVSVLVKQLMPHIRVIGVEAEDSASMKAALKAGAPTPLSHVGVFADGVAVRLVGTETFRLCQQHLDQVITVSNDEICAAVKDIFDDCRAVSEPSGAIALAGLKQYASKQQLKNQKMAAVLSGANVNFHSLRFVSERCELGEKKEAVLAVTIPERKGAFLEFCQRIGERVVTEFNYRYSDAERANIFVGIRLQQGASELQALMQDLRDAGYPVADLSDDEVAKLHVRYMVGGKPSRAIREQLYSFEFPECPGALQRFLQTLGTHWNITMFHYRNHGADYGRVLCGFELNPEDILPFCSHLRQLGYNWRDETGNQACQFFLSPGASDA